MDLIDLTDASPLVARAMVRFWVRYFEVELGLWRSYFFSGGGER
jgi:hypothetical protein